MADYTDPKWLREQLDLHGTASAVARANNLAERTVRTWVAGIRGPLIRAGAATPPTEPATPVELAQADRRAQRLEAEIRSLKARNRELARDANLIDTIGDLLAPVVVANRVFGHAKSTPGQMGDAPGIPTNSDGYSDDAVSLVLHLSDLHWGELVDEHTTGGANTYSPSIAALRVQHAVDVTRQWADNYQRIGGVREIVLVVNGDTASGQHNLHPDSASEYARIATQVLDSALIVAQVARDLARIASVRILGTVGNHTRSTRKMPTGDARTDSSWETLLHEFVAALLIDQPAVTTQFARGYRLTTKIGPSTWSFAHGDALRGGGGSLGIPAYALKRAHDASRDLSIIAGGPLGEVKHTRIGHFHTFTVWQVGAGTVAITPSPKGVDSFVTDQLGKYSPAGMLLEAVHPTLDIIGQHVIDLQPIQEPGEGRYQWGAHRDEHRTAASIMRESKVAA